MPKKKNLNRFMSFLLAFCMALSMLPGQALASDDPAPVDQPVIVEPVAPEEPEDPGIMPMAEFLDGNDMGNSKPD